MAITTQASRNSALIDTCGIVSPDGTIDTSDRFTLLGQYFETGFAPIIYNHFLYSTSKDNSQSAFSKSSFVDMSKNIVSDSFTKKEGIS